MTRLPSINVTCPNCALSFSACIYASINTWMDPELVDNILQDKLGVACPGCGKAIRLNYELMLSCRKGIVMISTSDPVEVNRQKLLDSRVIDEDGNIIDGFGSRKE